MNTRGFLHDPVVVTPRDTELFKRLLPKEMVPKGGVVGTEFDKLWEQDGILFKLRKGEDAPRTLFSGGGSSLLKAALEMNFSEWSLTVEKPVPIYTPGNIGGASRERNGIRRCLVVGRDFPCVVENKHRLLGEAGLHGVEHLFHAGTVVLILLMQLSKDVENDKIRRFYLNQAFYEVLSALSCHQEGEHHIVLVDQAQVWSIQIIADLFKFAEALSPRGFFGVKLQIEYLLWRWTVVTHHGFAFRYPGSNVECQEALARLWWTKEKHITGLWNETSD